MRVIEPDAVDSFNIQDFYMLPFTSRGHKDAFVANPASGLVFQIIGKSIFGDVLSQFVDPVQVSAETVLHNKRTVLT